MGAVATVRSGARIVFCQIVGVLRAREINRPGVKFTRRRVFPSLDRCWLRTDLRKPMLDGREAMGIGDECCIRFASRDRFDLKVVVTWRRTGFCFDFSFGKLPNIKPIHAVLPSRNLVRIGPCVGLPWSGNSIVEVYSAPPCNCTSALY